VDEIFFPLVNGSHWLETKAAMAPCATLVKGMHVLNRLQRPGTDYNDFIFSRIVTVPTLTLCSGTSLPGSSDHRLSLWATLVDKCDWVQV